MMGIPQWSVRGTRGPTEAHTFEAHGLAMAFAASRAEAERPAIVTNPDGTRVAVFRLDERVELSARRVGTPWRLVVYLADAILAERETL